MAFVQLVLHILLQIKQQILVLFISHFLISPDNESERTFARHFILHSDNGGVANGGMQAENILNGGRANLEALQQKRKKERKNG